MLSDQELTQLSENLDKIYPAPQVLFSLIEAVNNPESGAASVEELINKDPAFEAKILKMANSAYYGYNDKVSSVHQAIILLGFNTILDLTINICVHDLYHFDFSDRGFTADALWKHSVGVSLFAKIISKMRDSENYEDYITLGILHDMGLVVEAQFYKNNLLSVLGLISPDPIAKGFLELEEEVIGRSHPFLTNFFCFKWRLPRAVSEPALYHHDFKLATDDLKLRSCILNLADQLTMDSHFGLFIPYQQINIRDACEYLGFSDNDVKDIKKQFESQALDIEIIFS